MLTFSTFGTSKERLVTVRSAIACGRIAKPSGSKT